MFPQYLYLRERAGGSGVLDETGAGGPEEERVGGGRSDDTGREGTGVDRTRVEVRNRKRGDGPYKKRTEPCRRRRKRKSGVECTAKGSLRERLVIRFHRLSGKTLHREGTKEVSCGGGWTLEGTLTKTDGGPLCLGDSCPWDRQNS